MNDWNTRTPAWNAPAVGLAPSRLAFLKKVFGLFAGSIAASAVAATLALSAGADASPTGVPPLVALVANHPIVTLLLMLGSVFGASAVRHKPGVNVLALFGMATLIGVLIAPALFVATAVASQGGTISASPVRDAFLLATVGFGGLSGYAALSKRDFSYMGGALTMGLFVVLGAGVLNMFIGSNPFGLAIASVSVLLFGAYILYDVSRLARSGEDDAVGGAISLYLNFLNLFLSLLRILSARRN
jgi:modulator of FtsH protease